MPPRTKKEPSAPSTMKELKDTLWKAADKLRGSMDASQYKDVILGLVFLKYVSDAYAERRAAIRDELTAQGMDEDQVGQLIDDAEEYHGYGVFVVPPTARWDYLAQHAKGLTSAEAGGPKTVGELVDDAMDLVMGANPSLAGTLPRIFNRDNVDQRRLGELLDLFNSARFTRQGDARARDLLGEVYEYFLEKFARAEGKRGGEFYTPASRRQGPRRRPRTHPRPGLRPVLRLGRHVRPDREVHLRARRRPDGRAHLRPGAQRAHLADGQDEPRHPRHRQQGPAHPLGRHLHPRLPRRCRQWTSSWPTRRSTSRTGTGSRRTPAGSTASHPPATPTTPGSSTSSPSSPPAAAPASSWPTGPCPRTAAERARSAPGSSRPTSSPAWSPCPRSCSAPPASPSACGSSPRTRPPTARARPTAPGRSSSSTPATSATWSTAPSAPSPAEDIARIADTYHAWRGTPSAHEKGLAYADVPGFCASVPLADIKAADYALTPGRYVGAPDAEDDGEPIEDKIDRLTKELFDAVRRVGSSRAGRARALGRLA